MVAAALGLAASDGLDCSAKALQLHRAAGKLQQAESLAIRAEAAFHELPVASYADRSANRQIPASIYLGQHR